MSKQIALRLADDLVAFLDDQVVSGRAKSRVSVVTQALERERRRVAEDRDVAILKRFGNDPDLDHLARYQSGLPIDVDG
jgi:Arc/MetJ-type ribon-helix-helix transcriptional regulator